MTTTEAVFFTAARPHVIFAYRNDGTGKAENLPIALASREDREYLTNMDRDVADWKRVATTTGQLIEMRPADCGSGCRCAMEWRPVYVGLAESR